jgi:hypothetical protein
MQSAKRADSFVVLLFNPVEEGSCYELYVKLDQSTRSYNPKEVTIYLLYMYIFFRLRNE